MCCFIRTMDMRTTVSFWYLQRVLVLPYNNSHVYVIIYNCNTHKLVLRVHATYPLPLRLQTSLIWDENFKTTCTLGSRLNLVRQVPLSCAMHFARNKFCRVCTEAILCQAEPNSGLLTFRLDLTKLRINLATPFVSLRSHFQQSLRNFAMIFFSCSISFQ